VKKSIFPLVKNCTVILKSQVNNSTCDLSDNVDKDVIDSSWKFSILEYTSCQTCWRYEINIFDKEASIL